MRTRRLQQITGVMERFHILINNIICKVVSFSYVDFNTITPFKTDVIISLVMGGGGVGGGCGCGDGVNE